MDEETIMRAAEMEQQARGLEENMGYINIQISELEAFKDDLGKIAKSKRKEMLSSIGKRVYIKAVIEDSSKLFVDVGAGVVVRKTPEETVKIVNEQIERLQEAKIQISKQIEIYHNELNDFIRTTSN